MTSEQEWIERAARIIDPDAWHETLPTDGCGVYWIDRRNKARRKAQELQPLVQEAVGGWRDIGSAPRDWDDVLVFSPEHECFNCGGVFSAFYGTDRRGWFTHGPSEAMRLNPTHWLPLPPAPKENDDA